MNNYNLDDKYYARCIKRLQEWNAPLEGWTCIEMIDLEEVCFVCELCDYDGIRYVHKMHHDEFFEDIEVGCICAGIMEGDILAAKARDRALRNRAKRKLNFLNRKWKHEEYNCWTLNYQNKMVCIKKHGKFYNCSCGFKTVYRYKGKGISDFKTACYAAFDLADPVSEVWKC